MIILKISDTLTAELYNTASVVCLQVVVEKSHKLLSPLQNLDEEVCSARHQRVTVVYCNTQLHSMQPFAEIRSSHKMI